MSPIISVITAIIVAPITWIVAVAYRKNSYESKIGSAEEKSREIIDEALKVAETKKKEALLKVVSRSEGYLHCQKNLDSINNPSCRRNQIRK